MTTAAPSETDAPARPSLRRFFPLLLLLAAAAAYLGYRAYLARKPYEWSGTVEARVITVGSRVGGRVKVVLVHEGEVVQAGQTVFMVARDSGWDAVFDVPAQVLRTAPGDADVIIALTDDPNVSAKGRVRQVDPQADPVTRTFKVRVAVNDPPSAMRLGATVSGRVDVSHGHGISLPASALTATDKSPAVWVVDPDSLTVALKPVEVLRFDPGTVVLSGGLDGGEIVVTAGVQALHSGQKVRPLGVRS